MNSEEIEPIERPFKVVPDDKPTTSYYQRADNSHSWDELLDRGLPSKQNEKYYREKFFKQYKHLLGKDKYFSAYVPKIYTEDGKTRGSIYLVIASKSDPFHEGRVRLSDHWNGSLPQNSGALHIKTNLGKKDESKGVYPGRKTYLQYKKDGYHSSKNKPVEVGVRINHTEHEASAREWEARGLRKINKIYNHKKYPKHEYNNNYKYKHK